MIAPRVAGFAAAAVARMNGTELECSTAGVVGWLLATCEAFPSTEDIRAAAHARTGRRPAYGTVARVLSMLRAACVLDWQTAHVRRFHGDEIPAGAIVPVRQLDAKGSPAFRRRRYLLPVRRLALVGFALAIVSGGVAPVADSIVSDARSRLGSRVQPAQADAVDPVREELGTRLSLSIESAPRAESAPRSLYAQLASWRPPDDA